MCDGKKTKTKWKIRENDATLIGDLFFSHITSLTGLLDFRNEEKQSPNVREEECNIEIFFPVNMLMDVKK